MHIFIYIFYTYIHIYIHIYIYIYIFLEAVIVRLCDYFPKLLKTFFYFAYIWQPFR